MSLLREAAGYGVASVGALAVDVGVLFILVHYQGWPYLAAATASFLLGATVAYGLSVTLAFKRHRLHSRLVEFVSFVAIGVVGLAINAAVMWTAVEYFGLHYLMAKCIAAGFTCLCNFLARRQFLFVQSSSGG